MSAIRTTKSFFSLNLKTIFRRQNRNFLFHLLPIFSGKFAGNSNSSAILGITKEFLTYSFP